MNTDLTAENPAINSVTDPDEIINELYKYFLKTAEEKIEGDKKAFYMSPEMFADIQRQAEIKTDVTKIYSISDKEEFIYALYWGLLGRAPETDVVNEAKRFKGDAVILKKEKIRGVLNGAEYLGNSIEAVNIPDEILNGALSSSEKRYRFKNRLKNAVKRIYKA